MIFPRLAAAFGLALLTVAALAAAPTYAQAPNLVTNGGFETGDFSGWTAGPTGDLTVVSASSPGNYDTYPPHSGIYCAQFASSAPADDVLSQAVPTVAGSTYVFSFWLANVDDPGTVLLNDFKVMFENDLLLSLQNAGEFSYTQYQFSAIAAGSSTLLTFSGRQPPGTLELDDISVVPAAVPEASSVVSLSVLLALGVGGMAAVSARRRRKVPASK